MRSIAYLWPLAKVGHWLWSLEFCPTTTSAARPASSRRNMRTAFSAASVEDTAIASAAEPSAAAIADSQPDSICINAATEPRIPDIVSVAAKTAAPPSRRAMPCSSASRRAMAPARSRSASCSSSLAFSNSFSAVASALAAWSCSLSRPSSPASMPAT